MHKRFPLAFTLASITPRGLLLAGLGFAAGGVIAWAGLPVPSRDYSVIAQRNPFGLRPPPPPKPLVRPAPPKEDLFLTGITAIGRETAYLMTQPRPGRPAQYLSLGEGEEKDGVRVLEIDASAKTVRLLRSGDEMVLSFQTAGVKPGPAPRPSAKGVASSVSSRVLLPTTSRAGRALPTRTVRVPSLRR